MYENYEKVGTESQVKWDTALNKIQNQLETEAPKYLNQERIRAAKTSELSKMYMLG
jgi:hypothetical protein